MLMTDPVGLREVTEAGQVQPYAATRARQMYYENHSVRPLLPAVRTGSGLAVSRSLGVLKDLSNSLLSKRKERRTVEKIFFWVSFFFSRPKTMH
jgi:hypothetical protein